MKRASVGPIERWRVRRSNKRWVVAGLMVLVLALTAATALASSGGGYLLDWWTVDSGGATASTGGGYSLGGTAGQAEANLSPASSGSAGGGYTLHGGFWRGSPEVAREPDIFLPIISNSFVPQ